MAPLDQRIKIAMSVGAKLFSGKIKREGKASSSEQPKSWSSCLKAKLSSFQPLLLSPLLGASSKQGAVYEKLRGVPSTANRASFPLPGPGHLSTPTAARARRGWGRGSGKRHWWQDHRGNWDSRGGAGWAQPSGHPALNGPTAAASRPRAPRRVSGATPPRGLPGTLAAATSTPTPWSCPGAALHQLGRCGRESAAGRLLPVDLERERAALCARQRGHGAPAALRPLGSLEAPSGGPVRRRAAAARAERDASLICQSQLETSAFPPSALKSPRGRAQPQSCGGQPCHPAPGPAPRERRARRVWTHRGIALRMLGPPARFFPGPWPQAERSSGGWPGDHWARPETPSARSCEAAKGLWARAGNARLPPALHSWREVGKPTLEFFAPGLVKCSHHALEQAA